ncbi:MAG TPA: HAD family hydrolase [Polyangiaceae bacterium]|nr:HAD family hydrolase [Polyangiaceae bacterium]
MAKRAGIARAGLLGLLFMSGCGGAQPPPEPPPPHLVVPGMAPAPTIPREWSNASSAPAAPAPPPVAADALPSWNEGATKQAIVAFVRRVTTAGGPDFVPVPERVAVFDNDGTLWSEQPMYIQLAFALDRVRGLAPGHPEWKTKEPFKSVLAGDVKGALAGGEKSVFELVAATHSGMTTEDFEQTVKRWLSTAKHPKYGRLYVDCVYEPMLEVLAFLRANGFKTFVVSGGGSDFMRAVSEQIYGIPPEQVVGSTGKLRFELRSGRPVIVREAGIGFVNDSVGKPVGIQEHIGRRPIAAFGNSDGDQAMLEWTAGGPGARLMVLVHHTDGVREVAYDRASPVGKLDKALDEAKMKSWVVASMKDDWKTIFPPARAAVLPPAPAPSTPPAPPPVAAAAPH